MGDKPQIHSYLVFELRGGGGQCLKGKRKEAGANHPLVTFLDISSSEFQGVRMSPVCVLWPGGPWLAGLLAHLDLEEQPESVR